MHGVRTRGTLIEIVAGWLVLVALRDGYTQVLGMFKAGGRIRTGTGAGAGAGGGGKPRRDDQHLAAASGLERQVMVMWCCVFAGDCCMGLSQLVLACRWSAKACGVLPAGMVQGAGLPALRSEQRTCGAHQQRGMLLNLKFLQIHTLTRPQHLTHCFTQVVNCLGCGKIYDCRATSNDVIRFLGGCDLLMWGRGATDILASCAKPRRVCVLQFCFKFVTAMLRL